MPLLRLRARDVEGLGLLDAQHPERVPTESLALKRTRHQRASKPRPDPRNRHLVEVTATDVANSDELPQAFVFLHPSAVEAIAR